ncbi:MAG: hypothetical protein BMS9Abin26_0765 [Gammaproteobacteria bacterium]|nr:MAG: hypothetical protein BMS9Abin26_0765 [Gammaproteobacteria bacterium]
MLKQLIIYGIFIAIGYYVIGAYNENKALQEYDTTMDELRQSAEKYPDVTETEAIAIEARKMASKRFSGGKGDKINAAAMFYGFKYRHVVGYAKYCRKYNLPVDNYISAFNDYYQSETASINKILNRDVRSKLDNIIDEDVMRMIKIEFRDSTSQYEITEEQICTAMNIPAQAESIIRATDFKKQLPQAYALIL